MAAWRARDFGIAGGRDGGAVRVVPDFVQPIIETRDAVGFRERRLAAAVLLRGLIDAGVIAEAGPRLQAAREEAQEWIRSTDRSGPFSFENVCFVLGLRATALRVRAAQVRGLRLRRLLAEGRRMKVSVPSRRQLARRAAG